MSTAEQKIVRVPKSMPPAMVADLLKRKAADDELGNWKETLSHEIYDQAICKGGETLKKGDYELFAVPTGERTITVTADGTAYTKTEEHTNLTESRRLSQGRAMVVTGMYAHVTTTGNPDTGDDELAALADPTPTADTTSSAVNLLADLQHLISFEFVSDETRFERGKLRRFTSPQGISGFSGSSANNSVANNGLGRGFRLPIPRDIYGNRDFGIVMRCFRDVKITRTTRIEFILDGWLIRPAR